MGADPRSLQDMVRILNGFRPGVWPGRYVVVRRADDEWAVAELTTDRAQPFRFVAGERHASADRARAAAARLAGPHNLQGGRR